MPIMIKLTHADRSTVWINAEKITWMWREGNKTVLYMQDDAENGGLFKETPEEIHMIIEEEVANMNNCARRKNK